MAARHPFLLDPDLVHLNHGSFGACPRAVFDVYQGWQRELERRPVELLARRLPDELTRVRLGLAEYLGASSEDLALVPNATSGLNAALRSLPLRSGDEILTTDHEYGAVDLLLEFISRRSGARVVRRAIPPPYEDAERIVEAVWSGATARTRILLMSHVTSVTALLLPAAELCRRAREAGVVSVVDGAHVAGQIEVELDAIGADVFAGTCHKWLYAPKGSGFLYVRGDRQSLVDPLVVSWGIEQSSLAERHESAGTRDPAAYLSVPAAIEFTRTHGRAADCRARLSEAARELAAAGFPPLASFPLQMASFRLPPCDPERLQRRLRQEHAIEALAHEWNGDAYLRVSIAAYNTREDLERLTEALPKVL